MSKSAGTAGVVLVGRTNVGKSTLFNRLVGGARAIVSPEPGTTRDTNRAPVRWRGIDFWLEDTGGLDAGTGDATALATAAQAKRALAQAQVVVLVVDGRTGLLPADRELAKILRRLAVPIILAINKIDGPKLRQEAANLHLGFPHKVLVSALRGSGTGDLLDIVVSQLTASQSVPEAKLRLGIVGKTNVGKSSLFNRLVGNQRSIVLPTPHTTRDAVREYVAHDNLTVELIDTAGLRRQLPKAPQLEQQSVQQTLQALTHIDVALLVVDGSNPATWQDQRLGDLVLEAGVAALVIINKSDLVAASERQGVTDRLARWLPMLDWAPALWLSALTSRGVEAVLPAASAAAQAWRRELSQVELSGFSHWLKRNRTTGRLPLGAFSQTGSRPPSFNLQLKTKDNIPTAISGFIVRELKRRYKLVGTPIRVRLEGLRKRG